MASSASVCLDFKVITVTWTSTSALPDPVKTTAHAWTRWIGTGVNVLQASRVNFWFAAVTGSERCDRHSWPSFANSIVICRFRSNEEPFHSGYEKTTNSKVSVSLPHCKLNTDRHQQTNALQPHTAKYSNTQKSKEEVSKCWTRHSFWLTQLLRLDDFLLYRHFSFPSVDCDRLIVI